MIKCHILIEKIFVFKFIGPILQPMKWLKTLNERWLAKRRASSLMGSVELLTWPDSQPQSIILAVCMVSVANDGVIHDINMSLGNFRATSCNH